MNLTQIKSNEILVFVERGKPDYPGKSFSEQRRELTEQAQPTYDAESGNRTRATLVGVPPKFSHSRIA